MHAGKMLLAFTTATGLGYLWFKRRLLKRKLQQAPPGSLGFWGLGEMLSFIRDPKQFDFDRLEKFGMNHTSHVFLSPMVRVGEAKDRMMVLNSEGKGWSQVSYGDHFVRMLGKDAIVVVTGERHVFLRKFLLSALAPALVKSCLVAINQCAEEFLSSIADGQVHSTIEFGRFSLKVLVSTIFGSRLGDEQLTQVSEHLKLWCAGFRSLVPLNLPFTTYGRMIRARKAVVCIIQEVVEKCKQEAVPIAENDLFFRIVHYRDENGVGLSLDEICDNVLILLFAGNDSTSSTIASVMALIFDPKNNDVLNKLRAELGGIKNLDELKSCEFLEAVIDETLRLVPVVNSYVRLATRDIHLSDGYIVPEGVRMAMLTTAAHFDRQFWGDPQKFDPERMMRIRKETPDLLRNYFMPFGGGNRTCIGENLAKVEIRIFFNILVSRYHVKFENIKRRPFPMHSLQSRFRLEPLRISNF